MDQEIIFISCIPHIKVLYINNLREGGRAKKKTVGAHRRKHKSDIYVSVPHREETSADLALEIR